MSIYEILLAGGGVGILLLFIEITPVKINPLKAIVKFCKFCLRAFGKAINAEVLDEIAKVRTEQKSTQTKLEKHIDLDDKREADKLRASILKFNNELIREIPHTEEEFVEILGKIDDYEIYCRDHENYKNGRAVHAIANINRVYDIRLEKHDFLSC